MSSPHAAVRGGFAAELAQATAGEHARAEEARLVRRLLAGELDPAGYLVLLIQLRAVYEALEETVRACAHDPVVAPIADPALERRGALDADIGWLLARVEPTCWGPLPATRAYVARLEALAVWPAGVVAHHYTRYLGDLSGGVHLRAAVVDHLGGPVAFYDFPGIGDAHAYKQRYRRRLDETRWDEAERAAVVAEVAHAYQLNGQVFAEVDRETTDAGEVGP